MKNITFYPKQYWGGGLLEDYVGLSHPSGHFTVLAE